MRKRRTYRIEAVSPTTSITLSPVLKEKNQHKIQNKLISKRTSNFDMKGDYNTQYSIKIHDKRLIRARSQDTIVLDDCISEMKSIQIEGENTNHT